MVAAHSRITEYDFQPVFHASSALREAHTGLRETAQRMFDSLQAMQQQLEQSQRQLMDEQAALQSQREQGHSECGQQNCEHLVALQQQHAGMQDELQSLRGQATEMARTIAQQQQQINHERAEWSGELSQMRRILDKQASWLQERTETAQSQQALADIRNEVGGEVDSLDVPRFGVPNL